MPAVSHMSNNETAARQPWWQVLLVLLSFSAVLPLQFLPPEWQHRVIIALIGGFAFVNVFLGFRGRVMTHAVYRFVGVWILYLTAHVIVAGTGGMASDYWFLFYLLLLVAGFSLPAGSTVILVGFLLIAQLLPVLRDNGWPRDPAASLAMAAQYLSLIIFSPLLLFLAGQYRRFMNTGDRLLLTEQLLRTYVEEDEAIVDVISAGICVVDRNLRVQEFSAPAARMLGLSETRVVGQPLGDAVTIYDGRHGDTEIGTGLLLQALHQSHAVRGLPCLFATASGQHKVTLHVRPIAGEASHPVGALLVFEDTHARQVFERRHPVPEGD